RGRVYRAFEERGRERARGIKAAASCRTPQRLRRLTPVFSIEASPIFMAVHHAAERHPETMKKDARAADGTRGSRGVDSKRTAPGQGRLLSGATSPHGSLARMSPRTRN